METERGQGQSGAEPELGPGHLSKSGWGGQGMGATAEVKALPGGHRLKAGGDQGLRQLPFSIGRRS